MPEDAERRKVFSSTIPKQRGAWSILLSCFALGTFVGGDLGINGVVLLTSIIFGYVARHSWYVYQRTKRTSERERC